MDNNEIMKNKNTLVKKTFQGGYMLDYEDERWDIFMRDHIDAGLLVRIAHPREIKNEDILKYEGDFYGFLKENGYDEQFHWIQLRNNKMNHPSEFNEKIKIVFLTPDDKIKELYSRFAETTFRHKKLTG